MQTLIQDFRYAVRMLLKNPGFTAITVLTLALGIGANTAIFSVVNAALLRSLPYPEPDRLVVAFSKTKGTQRGDMSWADLQDMRAQSRLFDSLAVFSPQSVNLTGRSGTHIEPGRLVGGFVSVEFLPLLGVTPSQGHGFVKGDDVTGAKPVAVISVEVWRDRFGGDSQLIGQTLTLNNQLFTVVGVLPEGFRAPYSDVEVWLPIQYFPNFSPERKNTVATVFGRMKPGVTLNQAQTELGTIATRLELQFPETNKDRGVAVVELQNLLVEQLRPSLLLLFGGVGFVLLIACANVANLLLSRAIGRSRELALRAALGADRLRLMRQLLTENLLLAMLGGGLGLLIGVVGIKALVANGAITLPGLIEVRPDRAVFGFTLGASLLTGLIFGLLPALRFSKPELNESLKKGGRTTTGADHGRLQGLLVISQIALSLTLLVGAGLMVRSFANLLSVEPGFDGYNVLTLEYRVPRNKYPAPDQQWRFHEQVVARVQALPGVESAAVILAMPHGGNSGSATYTVMDRPAPAPGQEPRAQTNRADPNYFRTMKIPLLQGRVFTEQDQAKTPPVVVINRTMAHQYWPDGNAVGKQVHVLSPDVVATVIGVVGDIRHNSLDEAALPQIYLAYAQQPHIFASLAVRTTGDPLRAADAVRNAIWSVDSEQPVWKVRTLEFLLNRSLRPQLFLMNLIGSVSILALILAAVGVYGVISYSVNQRIHEIGVRLALGAQPRDVSRMVLRQGLRLVLPGLGLGLIVSFLLMRLTQGLLFEVRATDPATFATTALVLLGVALSACWIPARRATAVDPMIALRCD